MKKVMNMTFASSLTDLCEVNSSFDTGVLRICYSGDNRNNSSISKEAILRNISTIYNCPIVTNYDRDTNTLGGHDMELVRDDSGLRIVNVTQPIGVIPESAKVWFDDYEEEDGTINEYLYAEVLVWKRQEAYQKIKSDGITAHSMEITVKKGKKIDGIYHIEDFEFSAFCLIGVEPCYESSALEMFSKQDLKQQLSEMMQDLKDSFSLIGTSKEVNDTHPQKNSTEGGERVLNEKMELIAKYGIDVDSLDFSIDDFSAEELTEKFEAMQSAKDKPADNGVTNDEGHDEPAEEKFALTESVVSELIRMLSEVKVEREWGECNRYWYVDCDFETKEVYCWDTNDWLLYGFTYEINGDSVTIDYDSKKRKKYVIADFDEGEQPSPFAPVFEQMEQRLQENSELEAKYQAASDSITTMTDELTELRQFKEDTEKAVAKRERENVLSNFSELEGNESFEALKTSCMEYSLEELEDKCYSIKGRMNINANFSLNEKAPKLPVIPTDVSNEPYGGVFVKYGVETNN